ncbi:Golgin candidate 1 [Quillaja saponaria]|uniref:Golgin candidate 1 n=1 Tax=Quillaja saponaria TaxID=32244 RepID=A0AAD7Q2Q7_QUISA|nr:Golgin candidate 1 [Quillaja saponaria]
MASWLKAAEDLFEVVDRRAKLVVTDLADEQSDSKSPASNGQGTQGKKSKSKSKDQKELVKIASLIVENTVMAPVDVTSGKNKAPISDAKDGTTSEPTVHRNDEQQHNTERSSPLLGTPLVEMLTNDVDKHDTDNVEAVESNTEAGAVTLSANGDLRNENASKVHEGSACPPAKGVEASTDDHPIDAGQTIESGDGDTTLKIEQERFESVITDSTSNSDHEMKDEDVKVEPVVNQKSHQEHEAGTFPMKVQDQLEEAQGLLKTANSSGQSKEARLARVCAGLSSRLQEYKSENAQLEELLVAEREISKSYEAHIKQLQNDLAEYKSEVTRVESKMAGALAAKNSEIEALVNSMDVVKRQAATSEGNLASLQASMESMMRNRELTETRMMQALREELASVERRAEEERAAHNATKMAAMEREVELEHRALDASTALARIQRIVDERTSKAAELKQKVAVLEVECASLNQEMQDMEAHARHGQKKSPDEANQVIQMQAWQEEVERTHQGQRDAESKLSSLEAEVQKMRVEMAAMKRDGEHYSRQEHMELEKRYRELTDLLYYKQTQLETMASEKSAAEFQLEKELKRLQEEQVEAERSRVSRRASSSWEDETEIKALEPLPLHHRHMAGASVQLQKAAKLLDSGAVRATRFLWRYPTARVILFCYLVFVHLFLMYLLHRLQEQADNFADREVAESMGLANPTLP